MKVLVATAALLSAVLVSAQNPPPAGGVPAAPGAPGAPQGVPGGPPHGHPEEFIPPIIRKAFEQLSEPGKEAAKKLKDDAIAAKKPITLKEIVEQLKQQQFDTDATILENALKELDAAIENLPEPVKQFMKQQKEAFANGHAKPDRAEIQNACNTIKGFSEADRAELAKVFPGAAHTEFCDKMLANKQ
uniref:DUF148 domain-containing protein n=1 Tax=Steinernema glaseri TaxID=37863 RepID=A0A1I7YMW9_9BILA